MRIGSRIQAFEWYHFNDLERPLTQILRPRHYMTLNFRETVRHTDTVTMKYLFGLTPYCRVSFRMTLSDLRHIE